MGTSAGFQSKTFSSLVNVGLVVGFFVCGFSVFFVCAWGRGIYDFCFAHSKKMREKEVCS